MARDGHEFRAWLAAARRAGRAAPSWSCRRSSASTATSARSPTATPPRATSPSRRRCSTASRRGIELGYSAADCRKAGLRRSSCKPEQTLADLGRGDAVVQQLRPGRHRRLLLGRHDRLRRRLRPADRLRGRLLRRRHREAARRSSRSARSCTTSASRTRTSRPSDVDKIKPRTRRVTFICTRPAMASTAISAPATMRPSAALARERSLAFFAKHIAGAQPRPDVALDTERLPALLRTQAYIDGDWADARRRRDARRS